MPLNNTLRWSDKDINKIELPLSTTGGKSGYIITLVRICKPKWRETQVTLSQGLPCYVLLSLVETYMQISGIEHIPPG